MSRSSSTTRMCGDSAMRGHLEQPIAAAKRRNLFLYVSNAASDTVGNSRPWRGKVLLSTLAAWIGPDKSGINEALPMSAISTVSASQYQRISPRDIAFIKVGDRANVKVTAYDFAIYGALSGRVVQVSADSIYDEVAKEGNALHRPNSPDSQVRSPVGISALRPSARAKGIRLPPRIATRRPPLLLATPASSLVLLVEPNITHCLLWSKFVLESTEPKT